MIGVKTNQHVLELISEYLGHKPNKNEYSLYSVLIEFIKSQKVQGNSYSNILSDSYRVFNNIAIVETENIEEQALFLVVNEVIHLTCKKYKPLAIQVSMNVPRMFDESSKSVIKSATKGFSEAGQILGLPVLHGSTTFESDRPFISVAILGERAVVLNQKPVMGDVFLINEKKNSAFSSKLKLELLKTLTLNNEIIFDFSGAGILESFISLAYNKNIFINASITKHLREQSNALLAILNPENEKIFNSELEKWDLTCTKIGKVSAEEVLRLTCEGSESSSISNNEIKEFKNWYTLNYSNSVSINDNHKLGEKLDIEEQTGLKELSMQLLAQPSISSKKWISEQFDSSITANNPGANIKTDSKIVLLNNLNESIAYSMGCINSSNLSNEAFQASVYNVFSKLTCTGAIPEGLSVSFSGNGTRFLNVCNEIANQMHIPQFITETYHSIHSGTNEGSVCFSVWGKIQKTKNITSKAFHAKGDLIFMLGVNTGEQTGEAFAMLKNDRKYLTQFVNSEKDKELQWCVRELIAKQYIKSAHRIGKGGIFTALVECAVPKKYGFDITTDAEYRTDVFLFGETPSRVIVSVSPEKEDEFIDSMVDKHFPFTMLGHVTKEELRIDDISYGFINDVKKIYQKSFAENFK
jgi:phosphoribosylformylglycinamidine (FGAM) synthase-like enzyme